jgi:hypothetical protein
MRSFWVFVSAVSRPNFSPAMLQVVEATCSTIRSTAEKAHDASEVRLKRLMYVTAPNHDAAICKAAQTFDPTFDL